MTYAVYQIWAGVTNEILGEDDTLWDHPFIKEIGDAPLGQAGVERDGLKFKEIHMHGADVGIGVIVHELDWTTEIDTTNHFDPSMCAKASEILERVKWVFDQEKFPLTPTLFHHLDLGG